MRMNNPIVCVDENGTSWNFALKITLQIGNIILLAHGVDTAAIGASFLDMTKDKNGVYHATFNCWQQEYGYNCLYDFAFASCTSMKSAHYSFSYKGRGYTIWP